MHSDHVPCRPCLPDAPPPPPFLFLSCQKPFEVSIANMNSLVCLQFAGMLGMQDVNAEQMSSKFDDMLTTIRQVNEQFKNAVSVSFLCSFASHPLPHALTLCPCPCSTLTLRLYLALPSSSTLSLTLTLAFTFYPYVPALPSPSTLPRKGGRGCLMSPPCLESQGCHLIPLCYLVSCASA